MDKEKNIIIPLKDLNLTSRFLFDEVMEDPRTHREVLEIIFGREVPLLDRNQTEKELRLPLPARSVRLDIFAMDEEQTVYGTEMQGERKNDLARRSRYYQSLIDTKLLESGIPSYNLLNQSYIVIIMTFDLFGYGKYRYTFEPRCREEPDLVLPDGATRIFLSTKGKNVDEVSPELVEFLHYVEETTDAVAEHAASERIRRIHGRVRRVRASEETNMRYLREWEEKYYEREEGREEGKSLGIKIGEERGRKQGLELARRIFKLEKEGKTPEEIGEICQLSVEKVREILS